MHRSVVLVAALTWVFVVQQVCASYKVAAYFEDAKCDSAPLDAVISPIDPNDSCSGNGCMNESGVVNSVACPSNYTTELESLFQGSAYLVKETYYDTNCSTLISADAYLLTGSCHASAGSSIIHVIAQIQADGSALVQSFDDAACSSSLLQEGIDNRTLASHACDDYLFRWYYYDGSTSSSSSPSSTSETPDLSTGSNSSLSVGAIAGICVAVLVVLVVVAVFIYRRFRSVNDTKIDYPDENEGTPAFKAHNSPMNSVQQPSSKAATSNQQTPMGQDGLWNDDLITAKRIPRDKVLVQQLVSRGAFGEVYAGLFNSEQVAIKMLLPSTRGNIQHVNEFLSEAKMTAMMEHARIVRFVGVAWDSLSDLCVVLEFMDGGDLRTLLDKYISEARPVGFDREKVTIALHVCHALVYLHSLEPAIIHRDLKSRNILLNHAMEAKLTDFGISRERLDRTMTANVGTKLWMAPEVMMGEKYDEKADMFSFGVVLSELDVHTLPYASAKTEDSGSRQLSDTAILQKVAMGALRVDFSQEGSQTMAELGCACVSVDPIQRPSAAEVLYRLQLVLTHEIA